MLPTEQALELAQQTLDAPINNLIVSVAIFALAILGLTIFVLWKSSGFLAKFFNVMTENIQKLTTLEQQNSEQSKNILEGLNKNTTEMSKQTGVIEVLSHDTRSYQTLVSDNLAAHTQQIEANTAKLDKLQESQVAQNAALRKSIDDLTTQITRMLTDDRDCLSFTNELKALEDRLLTRLQQPTPAVATHTLAIDATNLKDAA